MCGKVAPTLVSVPVTVTVHSGVLPAAAQAPLQLPKHAPVTVVVAVSVTVAEEAGRVSTHVRALAVDPFKQDS